MGLETGTYISDLNTANPTGADAKSQGDDHLRLLKSTIKTTFPNISGAVTSSHAELNILDGATLTVTELNYVDGVTSAIQTQLNALSTNISNNTPEGVIVAWNPGYYTDGSNGGYTNVLGAGNTVAQANAYLNSKGWYVCDGSALNSASSTIFNGSGRYLPNLTDDRFLMGDTVAGGTGGTNTMAHTHGVTISNHTHTGPSHTHDTVVPQAGWGMVTTALTGLLSASNENDVYNFATNGDRTLTSASGGNSSTSSGGGETITSDAASNTENRPLYLSCFYIMKAF